MFKLQRERPALILARLQLCHCLEARVEEAQGDFCTWVFRAQPHRNAVPCAADGGGSWWLWAGPIKSAAPEVSCVFFPVLNSDIYQNKNLWD